MKKFNSEMPNIGWRDINEIDINLFDELPILIKQGDNIISVEDYKEILKQQKRGPNE